ncbi:hypothetical protein GCM10008018_48470 [Paenibacillus marchantiophytorum]|uniref:ATP-grasp domain-containing protein n=1 Tax=Paenibacillus marchantiophytorum TaxID=1619310 RepID=A0ABQ1F1Y8_9BACL|nr:ATP-grasp domain-containing protein [Paenibacillus marchantiophytorum]GFZ96412.1 hypothetical protein GCM10008018_48470 [Paenibacillus marchantiophytorum]
MRFLFCSDPLNQKWVDSDYEIEYRKAIELGIKVELFSLEDLLEGNCSKAIKRIPSLDNQETVIYRGWMMKPDNYEQLYRALEVRNLILINTPEEYVHCHYFPNSYEVIQAATPLSIWKDIHFLNNKLDNIHEELRIFGNRPILIKDYVKSRKHEWEDACFIPDASDRNHVRYVVNNLIERQGTELNGGVVFREYVELEHLIKHPVSGMPLSNEYRLFFLNHELLTIAEYWDEASYQLERPNLEPFINLAKGIKSHFFSMDIAKTVSGEWIVIETGDGQVTGLPSHTNIGEFYGFMKGHM